MITALGSRYGISGALGRSVKRPSVAGGGWWDLDGTIASCVAAYQPKGAASYAASKVNLANSGTYDLDIENSAPSWAITTGWSFDGTDDVLGASDYEAQDTAFTVIARVSGNMAAKNVGQLFSLRWSAESPYGKNWTFPVEQWKNSAKIGFTAIAKASYTSTLATPTSDSVIGIVRSGTGLKYFRDADTDTATIASITFDGSPFYIGGSYRVSTSAYTDFLSGNIYALAYYHEALSDAQMASLISALNAL